MNVRNTLSSIPLGQTLALQVIPPRSASNRDIAALETAMQGLVMDDRHPVAMEIARTARGRMFLLRATSQVALAHLADQVQGRYPQATILPLSEDEDPLHMRPQESVAAVELRPGAASYLPLRSWRERELTSEGTDPLLGVLAAMSHLPVQMRIVAQLALLPLPPTWSQADRRRAVEHPLEPERLRQRREMSSSGASARAPSTAAIMAMGILVALLLLWYRFSRRLPPWVLRAGTLLLHGKNPQLTQVETTQLILALVGIGLAVLLILLLFNWLLGHFRTTSIYDMRLVAEKTGRSAYRARLCLYVIASEAPALECLESEHRREAASSSSFWPVLLTHMKVKRELSPLGLWHSFQRWRNQLKARPDRQGEQVQLEALERLTAAYRQYHTAAGGYFVPRPLSNGKARRLLTHFSSCWERDVRRSRHILSVADVAVLWHLPQTTDLPALPLLERGRASNFLVPVELTGGAGWRIGLSTQAGHTLPVYLSAGTLRHNLLAVARTGKGKSTLFQHLARSVLSGTIEAQGLFLIEPHRDLIETLAGLIPPARQDDVVLVDLADTAYPPGINPLDATLGRHRDKTVDNLITIFKRIWDNSWGPRTENVLEYALKTLADANETLVRADPQYGPDRQYTLLDVVSLLRNTSFRHAVMQLVTDQVLHSWWRQYYEPMDLRFQMEVISSVLNKMSKFASASTSRHILGQPRSTLNMREIVRSGQILLVSTAHGIVGSDVGALIGSTLLGLFQASLAEQAELAQEERQHYLVLIDEFQVYSGADFGSMLAELRKYGGSFGLATQSLAYLDRLDRTLRHTVMANVDHVFAFAMSAEDARLLQELDGVEPEDITNLDDFMCYVKLTVLGRRLPVFSLQLDAPVTGDAELAKRIRMRNAQRYARPVDVVDTMLTEALERQTAYPGSSKGGGKNTKLTESEKEEEAQSGQEMIPVPTTAASPIEKETKKPGRRKHRGAGGKGLSSSAGAAEERPYSLPLLYESSENDEQAQEASYEP